MRRRWLLGVAAGALSGVAVGWLLAAPVPSSWVRALAVCVGSTVLGVTVLAAMVRDQRRPDVSADAVWRTLAVLGGVWWLLETVQVMLDASATLDVPVTDLQVGVLAEYLGTAGAGRVSGAAWLCVATIPVVATLAYRRFTQWPTVPVLAAAGVALIARPVTGHMAQQPLGSLLDAVHVLAAAVWFGTLVALALLVRSRGAWARLLPRYSTLALRCVIALAVTGVIDGAVRVGSLSGFVTTGYGQLLVAKALVFAVLLGMAWWWQRTWVPAASAHRTDADVSLRNAIVEVTVMSVAFGLAAALATTA